jgi:hypothetical protein
MGRAWHNGDCASRNAEGKQSKHSRPAEDGRLSGVRQLRNHRQKLFRSKFQRPESGQRHVACVRGLEASGVGPLIDEQKRIEAELEAVAKEACSQGGHSVGHVALQAASLMAVKLGSFYDCKAAPAVLQALLRIAEGRTQ